MHPLLLTTFEFITLQVTNQATCSTIPTIKDPPSSILRIPNHDSINIVSTFDLIAKVSKHLESQLAVQKPSMRASPQANTHTLILCSF